MILIITEQKSRNIIDEEIMAYLADEKSLDGTVDLIQERASILVSAQF